MKAKVKGRAKPRGSAGHILHQDAASARRVTGDKQRAAHPEEQILGHYWSLGMFVTHLHCPKSKMMLCEIRKMAD